MASYHFRTSLSTLTFTKQAIHRLAGLSVTTVRNANLMPLHVVYVSKYGSRKWGSASILYNNEN